MAKKKTARKKAAKKTAKKVASRTASPDSTSKPKFPYATAPNSLRRFLELVPKKPKPTKVNQATLRSWGFMSTNDYSIIRVLKALELVSSNNEPTDKYTDFMLPGRGPKVLGQAIMSVWKPLFEHSHAPHREDADSLTNYFNVHSGGEEKTIRFQIQTFKAACDHADFSVASPQAITETPSPIDASSQTTSPSVAGPAIHIDLHIHLPENKTRRDYECIFEDIGRYIMGRETRSDGSD